MAFVRSVQILLLAVATSLAAMCPLGWYRWDQSCLYFTEHPMNWADANATCAEMHGTLAVPSSETEQNFIWGLYVKLAYGSDLWIGCNDIEEEGMWGECPLRGMSGGYENWEGSQPDDSNGQDCGAIAGSFSGQWADRDCSNTYHAVCQQPADTSSTPAYCLRTGSDGRISSRCLVGHVVKELPADGVVSCGKACRLEPRCVSFNLLDQGGRGEKKTCQLNNVTSDAADEGDFEEAENCYLFDI